MCRHTLFLERPTKVIVVPVQVKRSIDTSHVVCVSPLKLLGVVSAQTGCSLLHVTVLILIHTRLYFFIGCNYSQVILYDMILLASLMHLLQHLAVLISWIQLFYNTWLHLFLKLQLFTSHFV